MRLLTPSCYASVLRLCATSLVLRLYSLLDDYFARDPLAVDDQLVDVHAGPRQLPGIPHVPVPVRAVGTTHRGGTAEGKTIERLARAPQFRDGHELGEHVEDPQGHDRPVTLEEQLPADPERDRGRRVKRIRAILLWPDRGSRGLPQCPPRSPSAAGVAEPSSASAASRAARNSARAPFAAKRSASIGSAVPVRAKCDRSARTGEPGNSRSSSATVGTCQRASARRRASFSPASVA